MSHNLGWKEAILEVLKRADAPMNCKDIADQISERDLRSDLGFTPANSVAAIIAISKPYPFKAVEFLQVEDPQLQQQLKSAVFKQMAAAAGIS